MTHSNLVLLQFNSRVGVPCLLDAVTQKSNGSWFNLWWIYHTKLSCI